MTDPYSILRVSTTASAAEIRRSFRELALKYHPDKNKNSEESKQKFVQIVEAYKLLSDENTRKEYDYKNTYIGSYEYTPSGQKWIFSNLNTLYGRVRRRQRTSPNSDGNTIRYMGKTTNALMRKGPMILIGSIASVARSFSTNSTPRQEKPSP
ncbi:MAG: J domain-containing protein [Nitrososphaeraceae archaeon]